MFLAAHGFATGATKILRGLYKRAVTLEYISKHAEKAERFVRYAAIHEYKGMNAALQVLSEAELVVNAISDEVAATHSIPQKDHAVGTGARQAIPASTAHLPGRTIFRQAPGLPGFGKLGCGVHDRSADVHLNLVNQTSLNTCAASQQSTSAITSSTMS